VLAAVLAGPWQLLLRVRRDVRRRRGVDGWRWLLIVGSLGGVVVWAMRRSLPESPRWHEIRGDYSFHIDQAEIFPTRIRGTAVGAAYSLSRLSGAILPFITVTVLDHLGADAVFVGSAVIMLDVGLLGPPSTGQVLERSASEVRGGRGYSGQSS
jgi:MFS family permease